MFLYSGKVNDCCGCMACSKACPVSAITMKVDEKGFLYPCVDEKTCLNCGLCVKTCPMEENYVGKDFEPSIYAVRCRDENVLNESSSGGMFSLLVLIARVIYFSARRRTSLALSKVVSNLPFHKNILT